jgi:hypothetical protein
MTYWQWFWTISLVVAGASFAAITVVVTVCGIADLREMFAHLLQQKDSET